MVLDPGCYCEWISLAWGRNITLVANEVALSVRTLFLKMDGTIQVLSGPNLLRDHIAVSPGFSQEVIVK